MANATGNLANVFTKQKMFDKALGYYERSIGFQQSMDDKSGMCSNFNSEADVYKERKDYSKSIELYLKAIELAKEIGARDLLKNAYRGIAEAYSFSGNFQEGYKYLFNYSDLKDTITVEDEKRNVAEMQARFDNENKEKKIILLEQQKQIDGLKANRQQNIIYFSVIGLVLVFILALVIFNRYRIKQKANVQLEQAYHVIEDKNKDITASINYARRIQQSLLPTEKYIHRNLERMRKKS
jgi:two-component system NarL family sensor kinase